MSDSFRSHGWSIDTREQDAHEFLNVLLTSIEEETQRQGVDRFSSICDLVTDDEEEDEEDGGRGFEARTRWREVFSTPPTAINSPEDERDRSGDFCSLGRRIRTTKTAIRPRRLSGDTTKVPPGTVFSRVCRDDPGARNYLLYSSQRRISASQAPLSPFSGILTSKVTYSDGRDEPQPPVSSSSFNNITLSLPKSPAVVSAVKTVSLETLLQMYVSRESVGGILKQLTFGRLPQCLCLHVQRTGFDSGLAMKRNDHVHFCEALDMGRYVYACQVMKERAMATLTISGGGGEMSSPVEAIPYRLSSVIVHLGVASSGHYVTYRRGPLAGRNADKWYLCSDEAVEETSWEVVKCSHAYMLFYERMVTTAT